MELSKKITSEEELLALGTKVLQLRKFTVQLALYNNNDGTIQEAAHHVITMWLKQQKSQEKAYSDILSALKESGMNQKAAEMAQLMEETTQTTCVIGETSDQLILLQLIILAILSRFFMIYSLKLA